MKKALGLALGLMFARHACADDTTHSQPGEQLDDVVVVAGGDCSLGSSRSKLPEMATDVVVEATILFLCSPDATCMHDVTLRSGRLIEGTGGPVGSGVRRVAELGRKQSARDPGRPASGWRPRGHAVSWR